MLPITIKRALISRSTRTPPTFGLSSFPPRARLWRFQKSAGCTTVTSAGPRSPSWSRKGSQPRNAPRARPSGRQFSAPQNSERAVTGWSLTPVVARRSLTDPHRVGARQANLKVRHTRRTRLWRRTGRTFPVKSGCYTTLTVRVTVVRAQRDGNNNGRRRTPGKRRRSPSTMDRSGSRASPRSIAAQRSEPRTSR
jgi:hypothetical protein